MGCSFLHVKGGRVLTEKKRAWEILCLHVTSTAIAQGLFHWLLSLFSMDQKLLFLLVKAFSFLSKPGQLHILWNESPLRPSELMAAWIWPTHLLLGSLALRGVHELFTWGQFTIWARFLKSQWFSGIQLVDGSFLDELTWKISQVPDPGELMWKLRPPRSFRSSGPIGFSDSARASQALMWLFSVYITGQITVVWLHKLAKIKAILIYWQKSWILENTFPHI